MTLYSHPGVALEGIFDIVNSFSQADIAQVNAIMLGTKICNINVLIDQPILMLVPA